MSSSSMLAAVRMRSSVERDSTLFLGHDRETVALIDSKEGDGEGEDKTVSEKP